MSIFNLMQCFSKHYTWILTEYCKFSKSTEKFKIPSLVHELEFLLKRIKIENIINTRSSGENVIFMKKLGFPSLNGMPTEN